MEEDMARIGMAPSRRDDLEFVPAPVTVCIPVHIPNLEGYHSDALEILKLCLVSLMGTTMPEPEKKVDIIVLLQECCPEVEALLDEWTPAFHISTPYNLGKVLASKALAMIAPGNYVCIADYDTFFYPGWYEKQLEILAVYPPAVVSGWTTRYQAQRFTQSTSEWAQGTPEAQYEEVDMRGQYEQEWAISVGRDVQSHMDIVRGLPDKKITFKNVSAYVGNTHSQFMANRALLWGLLAKIESKTIMREIEQLDGTCDEQKVLRLTTIERTTRHMGNTPDEDILKFAHKTLNWNAGQIRLYNIKTHDTGRFPFFLQLEVTRKLIFKVYNWLYRMVSI